MTKSERERIHNLNTRLAIAGFSLDEIETMRRCSNTLSRWCEAECNGEIERMTGSNKPEHVHESRGLGGQWIRYHYPIPDRENGAIKRMNRILANHPEWTWYYQTDPRGCSVYLYRVDDERLAQYPIDSIYSSIGIGIY